MTDYLVPFFLGLLSGAIVAMIIAGIFVISDSKENTMSEADGSLKTWKGE